MKLELVVDQITSKAVPDAYKSAAKARSLQALPDVDSGKTPLALVHHWREVAGPNRYDNWVSQAVAEQVAVITVCEEDVLTDVRQALFKALLGVQLPGYTYEIQYMGGEPIEIKGTQIWWRDIFQTQTDRNQEP